VDRRIPSRRIHAIGEAREVAPTACWKVHRGRQLTDQVACWTRARSKRLSRTARRGSRRRGSHQPPPSPVSGRAVPVGGERVEAIGFALAAAETTVKAGELLVQGRDSSRGRDPATSESPSPSLRGRAVKAPVGVRIAPVSAKTLRTRHMRRSLTCRPGREPGRRLAGGCGSRSERASGSRSPQQREGVMRRDRILSREEVAVSGGERLATVRFSNGTRASFVGQVRDSWECVIFGDAVTTAEGRVNERRGR
jgi:hypothetical protein